jgi:maltooligosyltrehalose trehalohydrolase
MEYSATQCGAVGLPDGSARWRVWAPRARRVDLVLFDNGRRVALPMAPEDYGYFRRDEAAVAEGRRYAYSLDGGPDRPDPASLWQPDGVHRPSAVLRPGHFAPPVSGWRGVTREEVVFYELHVGTFTPEGTFDAVIPRLDALRELGVTAVELMPVAQFPGGRNWGYDGVHPYAPQNSYGGPHGLRRLVNACHARGLAIFLDVVYNHFGPEGNYVNEFGPYFTDRYKTPWGAAVNYDDSGCDAVRDFVLDNVRLWVGVYGFDGLRLDAVHAIYDSSPRHILREIKEAADAAAAAQGRRAEVIAESDLNDVRLLLPPGGGGCGLDAQWSDDFHHAIHAYLTGERQGYYADFGPAEDFPRLLRETFLHAGTYSRHRGRRHGASAGGLPGDRFVIGVQNHDQIGNRARGDRLDALVSPPARRLAASLLLLAPHLPLLFMGEEYGEEAPFPFFCSFEDAQLVESVRRGRRREFAAFAWQGEVPDPQAEATFAAAKLSWSWPEGTRRAGLRRLYGDLLAARRSWPPLRDFARRSARLLPGAATAVLELVRGGAAPEAGRTVQAYFNLTPEAQALPGPPPPGGAVLFCSEARKYGGERGPLDRGKPAGGAAGLRPYECVVVGPADWARFV